MLEQDCLRQLSKVICVASHHISTNTHYNTLMVLDVKAYGVDIIYVDLPLGGQDLRNLRTFSLTV